MTPPRWWGPLRLPVICVGILVGLLVGAVSSSADTVVSNVAQASGTITVQAGSFAQVQLTLLPVDQAGDPVGCDATPATPVVVQWNQNAGYNITPAPFPTCNISFSTINAMTPGTYQLHATFQGGLPGSVIIDQADFTLIITPPANTPPTLSLPLDITAEAAGPAGAPVSYTATANDQQDGPLPAICAPSSGATFALGTTTVSCSATDSGGVTTLGSFNVTVQDTTAPSLTLPSDKTVEATGPSGAAVSFAASAADLVDGSVSVSCDANSGDTFPLGETTVHCSAADTHGNIASGSFNVTVQDTSAPTLHLPADITTTASSSSQATVSYSATATDLVDGSVTVSCTPLSGATFPVGTTTVSCSATDDHGNTATGGFHVTVGYAWTGFFQPVDNLPTFNVAKAGSSIPVKFSLGGDQGLGVLATGSPATVAMTCSAGAPTDSIETYTNSTAGLSYDPTANTYIYTWKTQPSWSGTCRQLLLKLADGSTQKANFQFTK